MSTKNINPEINDIMNDEEKQYKSGGKQTRILVVDDHPLVHEELVQLLSGEPILEVCGATQNADQALEIIERQPIDLVIVNVSMNNTAALQLAEKIRLWHPKLAVLTFSIPARDELLYVKTVLQSGIRGYVVNSKTTEEIITAIRDVQSLLKSAIFGFTIYVKAERSVIDDFRGS